MEFLLVFLLLALLVRIPPNQDRFKTSGYKPGFPPTHNYAGGVMPSAS